MSDWIFDHIGISMLATCLIFLSIVIPIINYSESEDEKNHPYSEWNRVITGYHLVGKSYMQEWHWERKK